MLDAFEQCHYRTSSPDGLESPPFWEDRRHARQYLNACRKRDRNPGSCIARPRFETVRLTNQPTIRDFEFDFQISGSS